MYKMLKKRRFNETKELTWALNIAPKCSAHQLVRLTFALVKKVHGEKGLGLVRHYLRWETITDKKWGEAAETMFNLRHGDHRKKKKGWCLAVDAADSLLSVINPYQCPRTPFNERVAWTVVYAVQAAKRMKVELDPLSTLNRIAR